MVLLQIRPADALVRLEPDGDQGGLFTCNVVRYDTGLCYIYIVGCICSTRFALNSSPPHRVVGDATFYSGYFIFSSSRLPVMPVVRGRLSSRLPSCNSARVPLIFHDGLPSRNARSYSLLFCRALSVSPLPVAQAACGRFPLVVGLVVRSALLSLAFFAFMGSIPRPVEVWEWVLRSRIFDSWSSS